MLHPPSNLDMASLWTPDIDALRRDADAGDDVDVPEVQAADLACPCNPACIVRIGEEHAIPLAEQLRMATKTEAMSWLAVALWHASLHVESADEATATAADFSSPPLPRLNKISHRHGSSIATPSVESWGGMDFDLVRRFSRTGPCTDCQILDSNDTNTAKNRARS